MQENERCINVDLSDTQRENCGEIAQRAVTGWRNQGIDEAQIQHCLKHSFPAIWPSFATEEEIQVMRREAATKLGVDISKVQVDGIREDGLVNLFVDW